MKGIIGESVGNGNKLLLPLRVFLSEPLHLGNHDLQELVSSDLEFVISGHPIQWFEEDELDCRHQHQPLQFFGAGVFSFA
jgi:hypothetical protein